MSMDEGRSFNVLQLWNVIERKGWSIVKSWWRNPGIARESPLIHSASIVLSSTFALINFNYKPILYSFSDIVFLSDYFWLIWSDQTISFSYLHIDCWHKHSFGNIFKKFKNQFQSNCKINNKWIKLGVTSVREQRVHCESKGDPSKQKQHRDTIGFLQQGERRL